MLQANCIVGDRIRRLRQGKGLSRQEIAKRLHVDVTAVAAWEGGKYLPRDQHRQKLAFELGADIERLFLNQADAGFEAVAARLIDTLEDLPAVLLNLLDRTRGNLKAIRLAAPYATAAYVQQEFRARAAARIVDRSIEILRVEIFYDLQRLKEVLSNIIRYDGCAYHVKAYCTGLAEVAPAMGGYFFDDAEFLLGGYWTGVPPHGKPGLHLSGVPFRAFFREYWNDVWQRGILLNIQGANDLHLVRESAIKLGLAAREWPQFVEEAHSLEIGDGAPPLF